MRLTVDVPLVALLATTGLLAPEIDDGSVAYLLAKPISRHTIVLSKLLVALGCHSPEEIPQVEIPTGVPMVFEVSDGKPSKSYRFLRD